MSSVFLTFSHQLFRSLSSLPKDQRVIVVEQPVHPTVGPAPSLVQVRASTQAVRERLLVKGYQTEYFEQAEANNFNSVITALAKEGVKNLILHDLGSISDNQKFADLCANQSIEVTFQASPAYLLTLAQVKKITTTKKLLSPKAFYIQLRKQKNLFVLPSGLPQGGKWLFVGYPAIAPKAKNPFTLEENRYWEEAVEYVAKREKTKKESASPVKAVTAADAEDVLDHFLTIELTHFGDSPKSGGAVYFYNEILPLLSLGLLTAKQVEEGIVKAMKNDVPLPSAERALWQLIGVREYARVKQVYDFNQSIRQD